MKGDEEHVRSPNRGPIHDDSFASGRPAAEILAWAATTGHVVISHDASTMTATAYERLERGEPVGGLVIVPQRLGIGEAVRRLVRLSSEAEQGGVLC